MRRTAGRQPAVEARDTVTHLNLTSQQSREDTENTMKQEELTDSAIDYILEHIDDSRLTKWEQSFVESVSDQWRRSRHLSDRQKEVLGNIWDKQL